MATLVLEASCFSFKKKRRVQLSTCLDCKLRKRGEAKLLLSFYPSLFAEVLVPTGPIQASFDVFSLMTYFLGSGDKSCSICHCLDGVVL